MCYSESFLTQQALYLYNISCIVVPQSLMAPFQGQRQGHFMAKVGVNETLIF
jgi:hypothetical protein